MRTKNTNERLSNLDNEVHIGFKEVNNRFDKMSNSIAHMVTNEIADELY